MKPTLLLPICLLHILPLALMHGSTATYTWAPESTEASAKEGGSGLWNSFYGLWWDGKKIISAGSNTKGDQSLPFGSATEDAVLLFNGKGGTITKSGIAFFGSNPAPNRTHTLRFAPGSQYTILSSSATPGNVISSGTLAHIVYDVPKDATLTFGGNGQQIALVTGSDISAGPGLLFTGGGIINLDSRTLVRNGSPNSRLTIREGTTLNFNTDSLYTAMAGSFTKLPALPARIALEEGTLTVNGGQLITGYHAKASPLAGPAGRGFGIAIGATPKGAPATLNLVSGEIIALGDPRAAGNDSYAGIAIGLGSPNKGGIVNLSGGTLTTTNIRAKADPRDTAILTLDGVTVKVTTAESPDFEYKAATPAQLQTRLDNFITGFGSTKNNHIRIGTNGVIFDTSEIDANVPNRTATIESPLHGEGGLTKLGGNGLRLTAANTYTGLTHVQNGTLLIDGKAGAIAGDVTVSNRARLGGTGSTTGNVTLEKGATLAPGAGFMKGGSLKWHAGAIIEIDLTTTSDAPCLIVKDLIKEGSGDFKINITGAQTPRRMLIQVTGRNNFSGSDITATINGNPANLVIRNSGIVLSSSR